MSLSGIHDYLTQSRDTLQATLDDACLISTIEKIAEHCGDALLAGSKLLLLGNGGSAADAQHIAGELVCRFRYDRPPVAAIALATDTSVLTAIGNDYGYEKVFERQVLALGQTGDVLIAISTSGRSSNVLRAIDAAREKRLFVIGFTGRSGGRMRELCDLCLCAPLTKHRSSSSSILSLGISCAIWWSSVFFRPPMRTLPANDD